MKIAASRLLGGLLLVCSPAYAGLFADDDARQQVKKLEVRIISLEKQLAEIELQNKLAVRSLLNLQMQLEMQSSEMRKQRGLFEEFGHAQQEAEKRQKDFYIDLDSRLRQLESGSGGGASRAAAVPSGGSDNGSSGENRAFETAYGFYRAESYREAALSFRDFLRQYPQSVHEANVYYWLGNANFLSREYAGSFAAYSNLLSKYPDHPRAPEAMLNMAECQLSLKKRTAARSTLKKLISQFPGSDASDKAKKRLATIK
ncbi:MAG: tol-pal system protein YbgF [Gammaproteobacteria bacterium]|nr:tol-pal system protein YbgF [Gammaproteobacteria bacterium]MBU1625482.1 tol-pal system protein YbgF [Gammaproteobacteria bacterium]MBU1980742.1 tol-pal system protein YbgF [Gammaproteobacteria bacterium]